MRTYNFVLMSFALTLSASCGSETSERAGALAEAPAQRLIGTWELTLWLDRPITLATSGAKLPVRAQGTLALVEARSGQRSFPELREPTHSGAYDIDLRVLGLPNADGDVPVAVARTTEVIAATPPTAHAARFGGTDGDSVVIVLSPGASRGVLLLSGTFHDDSIVGTWTVQEALGGGGRFVCVRHGGEAPVPLH